MYKGCVQIQKNSLTSLLKTAESLQIRGLGLAAQVNLCYYLLSVCIVSKNNWFKLRICGCCIGIIQHPHMFYADRNNTTCHIIDTFNIGIGPGGDVDRADHHPLVRPHPALRPRTHGLPQPGPQANTGCPECQQQQWRRCQYFPSVLRGWYGRAPIAGAVWYTVAIGNTSLHGMKKNIDLNLYISNS